MAEGAEPRSERVAPSPAAISWRTWVAYAVMLTLSGVGLFVGDQLTRPASALVGLVIAWLTVSAFRKLFPVRLRRVGDLIEGLPRARSPLRVGVGRVRVSEREHVSHGRYGERRSYAYDIYYVPRPFDEGIGLFSSCQSVARTRAFAEALCRLGSYPLEWLPFGASEPEVRAPESLNRSLIERLRRDPSGGRIDPEPDEQSWRASWDDAPGVRLVLKSGPWSLRGALGQLALSAAIAIGVGFVGNTLAGVAGRGAGEVLVWSGVAVAAFLAWRAVVLDAKLEVGPGGVFEYRRRFFGIAAKRGMSSGALEEIHVEKRATGFHLALAGDSGFVVIGQFATREEAAWARSMILHALGGSATEGDPASTG